MNLLKFLIVLHCELLNSLEAARSFLLAVHQRTHQRCLRFLFINNSCLSAAKNCSTMFTAASNISADAVFKCEVRIPIWQPSKHQVEPKSLALACCDQRTLRLEAYLHAVMQEIGKYNICLFKSATIKLCKNLL